MTPELTSWILPASIGFPGIGKLAVFWKLQTNCQHLASTDTPYSFAVHANALNPNPTEHHAMTPPSKTLQVQAF